MSSSPGAPASSDRTCAGRCSTAATRSSRSTIVTGTVANIEELFGRRGFTFVEHDVSSYIWVPGPVDVVMHLASPASPVDFERIPIQILKVGGLGTHNGLGLAKAKGATFFLASTSEVYGDPLVHPQPETYWGNVNPIGPRGVYDEAKRYAEAMTMAYHRHHRLDVRIVRIFNTYGPRMRPDDGRAVSNFWSSRRCAASRSRSTATAARPGRSPTSTTRSAGSSPCSTPTITTPVNIGNPVEYTISELAEMVLERHRVVVAAGARAAAGRRPRPAPARHRQGTHRARVGAARRPAPRAGGDDRLVPRSARRVSERAFERANHRRRSSATEHRQPLLLRPRLVHVVLLAHRLHRRADGGE